MNNASVFCIDSRSPEAARAALGGKGGSLLRLMASGLLVPRWCAVVPGACDESRSMPGALAEEIIRVTRGLINAERSGRPPLFAVRSSALDEDGAAHSFAGQLESFLNVEINDVPARVVEVWRSGFSERVRAYRNERGLSWPPSAPAVVIQVMVAARRAGVAFSVDPVTADWNTSVVAAVEGLGEDLVSGNKNADTFSVSRDGTVVASRQAERTREPLLSGRQAAAVANLARRAEALFGRPQDIEWAIDDGGALFILQARPITSLGRVIPPGGARLIWDNSNIAESYCGVTTPLTYSFARYIYEEVYRQFCRMLGVPERKLEENADIFGRMIGLVRGRIYYSLIDWYRALALLPGFTFNRRFMEQMMGVKEEGPADVIASLQAAGAGARLRDLAHLCSTIAGLLRQRRKLPRVKAAFHARLEAALALPATGSAPLGELGADKLAAYYRGLERQLLTKWDAPMVNDFFAMVYHGVLRRLCERWLGAESPSNDLVAGEGGMISTEPARLVEEMAELVARDSALTGLLATGTAAQARLGLASDDPLRRELREKLNLYLLRFGDRCMEELKLESPTLFDDPLPLYRAVSARAGALRAAPADSTRRARFDARGGAEKMVRENLARPPWRRWIFGRVLRRARVYVRDRENLRIERTRLYARVRLVFVELGRRLAALGALEEPRDVFYLTAQEALSFVEGTAATARIGELAALRKREFAAYREGPAPADRFETRGVVYVANPFTASAKKPGAENKNVAVDGETRNGLACCPGVVRARARVVLDPRGVGLAPGEILVAQRTDPGWVMLFPSASGLIVEHGSLLSHSAIVARELGLPAVVALDGATEWLRTGDEIELDGAAGTVRRLQKTKMPAS